jgi:hypothetical protein
VGRLDDQERGALLFREMSTLPPLLLELPETSVVRSMGLKLLETLEVAGTAGAAEEDAKTEAASTDLSGVDSAKPCMSEDMTREGR